MKLEMSYGGKPVTVSIPDGSLIDTIDFPNTEPVKEPDKEIINSLRSPLGTPALRELAQDRQNAVIVVPDRTRPAPFDMILPCVIRELEAGGIGKDSIKILIGLGTHREMTEGELETHLGSALYDSMNIIPHKALEPPELIDLGVTESGIPIRINRHVYESELVIAVGSVKPHATVGWSGGAKMLLPAVSSWESAGAIHWQAAEYQCSGNRIIGTTDNPVREAMEKYAEKVGLDFIVNYVLNAEYQLIYVCSGHYIQAHRRCVELGRSVFTFKCKSNELADIFIAGSPKVATNMWTNGTGPTFVDMVTKKGGTVIKMAACPDGVAREHPDVLKYGYISYKEVKELVEKGTIRDLAAADHIARSGSRMHDNKLHYIMVSDGVSASEAEQLGMEYASTPQEAVDMAFKRHGKKARVYAYPRKTFAPLIVEMDE